MVRTITQIAGDYGISQNANKDIFANTEAATLAQVDKTLAEMRSQNNELNAAKGMGRSTFSDAIQAQQEKDVLAPVFTQFAQARQAEDINQANFGRSVISQGIAADIYSQQAAQNAALTQETTGFQIGKQTAATQAINQQSAQLQQQNTAAQIQQTTQATKDINQQASQLQQQNTTSQIQQTTQATKDINQQNAQLASASLQEQFGLKRQEIQQNFDNQIAALEKQTQLQMENLPEELRLKVEAQKQILQDQIRVQRQTAFDNLQIQFMYNTIANLVPGLRETTGGLNLPTGA
jgi:hypothetical protein